MPKCRRERPARARFDDTVNYDRVGRTPSSVGRSKAPQKFLSRPAALKLDAEVDRALAQIIQVPQRWAVGSFSTRRSCVLFSFGEKSGLGGFPVAFDSARKRPLHGRKCASEI